MTDTDDYASQRAEMVAAIEQEVQRARDDIGTAQLSASVMRAMAEVPRHEFVPESERSRAYWDCALPIGYGQTISQPFIVALMTDLVAPEAHQKILEIGTGSGYQAAVLSLLVDQVYSIERVPTLTEQAARRLSQLGYTNVAVKSGDGCQGWPEAAPFDGIIVTAGGEVPPALLQQLKAGGRLVIPVGDYLGAQNLTVYEKQRDGQLRRHSVLPVRFVPLVNDDQD